VNYDSHHPNQHPPNNPDHGPTTLNTTTSHTQPTATQPPEHPPTPRSTALHPATPTPHLRNNHPGKRPQPGAWDADTVWLLLQWQIRTPCVRATVVLEFGAPCVGESSVGQALTHRCLHPLQSGSHRAGFTPRTGSTGALARVWRGVSV